MFAPEFSMLITSASAMLALVGASGIGYAAGKRRRITPPHIVRAEYLDARRDSVVAEMSDGSSVSADRRHSIWDEIVASGVPIANANPALRSDGVFAGRESAAPQEAQAVTASSEPQAPAASAPITTSVLQSPPEIAPSPPQARWALKPVHYVSDDQNVAMFARFLREIAAGTHALCADDVHVNVPGGLVPLLDDASLAADWLLLDELHEFYRGWCRLEGVMPITRAVLQEKIEAAGAVKKRHWAEGGTCERLRARVPPSRLPQRPTLVRVLSLREMERRERSRHAGAGRATSDQDVMYTRAA